MELRRWRRHRVGRLTALSLFVALGFSILSGLVILDMRRDAWARAGETARNLNRAVGQDIGRTFETLDLFLQAVVANQRSPGSNGPDPSQQGTPLLDRLAAAPHLGPILVLDAAARPATEGGPTELEQADVVQLDCFQVHRDHLDVGLYVSRPFRGRLTGKGFIGVSRRLSNPDGSFAGVVLGTLKLDHFRDLLGRLTLGPGDRVTLMRDDGITLMRSPDVPETIGRDLSGGAAFRAITGAPEGQYRSISRSDGVDRLHSYARIDGLPLILNVGLAARRIEAGWLRRAAAVGGTTLVLVGCLLTGTVRLRRELAARRAAELASMASEARFRLLAENTSDVVSRIGADGVLRYVSPASGRVLGSSPGQLVGRPFEEVIDTDDREAIKAALASLCSGQADEATVACRARQASGRLIWLESTLRAVADPVSGVPDGVVAVSRDVTERKAQEAELARLARLDGLTGLTNRRGFDEALGREWTRCGFSGTPVSLLLVDVDHFKALNDRYGHQDGDACLRVVAATVGATIRRASDLAARYGGEELAVLLPETDAAGAEAVAERLRAEVEALGLPNEGFGVRGAVVTVSVGVATGWPAGGAPPAAPGSLVGAADRALYEAKRGGRNRIARSASRGDEGVLLLHDLQH